MRESLTLKATAVAVGWAMVLGAKALPAEPVPASSVPPENRHTSPVNTLVNIDSLPAAVARALERDPQVRSTQALEAAAQARLEQAKSRWWPTATMDANVGQNQELEGNSTVNRKTSTVDAGMRWNLYNGGNDVREMEASEKEWHAAREDLRKVRQDVAQRVAEAYLDLVREDRQWRLAQISRDEIKPLVERVQEQLRLGKSSEADLLQAKSSLLNAESYVSDARNNRVAAMAKLEVMLGQPITQITPYTLPAVVNAAADSDAVMGNAAVSNAQARASAARSRVNTLLELAAPRVDLTTSKTLSDHTTPTLSTTQQHSWSVGVAWSLPLGGEPLHRRNDVIHRAVAAEQDVERTIQDLRTELLSLPARLNGIQEQTGLLSEQISNTSGLIKASQIQYEAGRRNLQQLIELRTQHHNLQQRLIDEEHQRSLLLLRRLSLRGELLQAMAGQLPTLAQVPVAVPVPKARAAVAQPVQPDREVPLILAISAAPAAGSSSTSDPWARVAPVQIDTAEQAISALEATAHLPSAPAPTAPTAALHLAQRTATPAAVAAPAAAPSPVPAPTGLAIPPQAVQAMADWLQAWSSKDVERYLAAYAADFDAGQMPLAKWREMRRQRLSKPGDISVQAVDSQWHIPSPGTAVVIYTQHYRANDYRDTVRKQITWQAHQGLWLIAKEQILPTGSAATSAPTTVKPSAALPPPAVNMAAPPAGALETPTKPRQQVTTGDGSQP